MPYKIVKSGDRYCVHKKLPDGGTGKKIGCHDSKGGAVRQMRAIYANEGSKGYPEYDPSQKRGEGGQWVSGGASADDVLDIIPMSDTAQIEVRRVGGKEGIDALQYIKDAGKPPWVGKIPNGSHVRLEDGRIMIVERSNGYGIFGRELKTNRSLAVDLRNESARILGIAQWVEQGTLFPEGKSLTAVIKGDDGARYMFLVTTNAYKDRENEIIKADVLKQLVESKWDGDAYTGDDVLLFWHKGEPIGDIVYADTVGRFLVEVAKERPDAEIDLGRGKTVSVSKVWDFIEQTSQTMDWGASHGFKYFPQDREGGVYNHIVRKWETSVLPVQYAANVYTYAGVKRNGKEK